MSQELRVIAARGGGLERWGQVPRGSQCAAWGCDPLRWGRVRVPRNAGVPDAR